MKLKKAFFLITCCFLLLSFILVIWIKIVCDRIRANYPIDGVMISIKYREEDTEFPIVEMDNSERMIVEGKMKMEQRLLAALDYIWFLSCVFIPAFGMAMAGVFFYHLKCERAIQVLKNGTEQIRNHNLDFQIPPISKDELGELCGAFETMRVELLQSNQELWRQTEERKRLNAAFSHDLRNPVMVIKGTVKMLRQGVKDDQAIERLEYYILRIEQYVEAMSNIQRLEQMPVQISEVDMVVLKVELKETIQVLTSGILAELFVSSEEKIWVDHGIVLTVAENLIGNAARYVQKRLMVFMEIQEEFLVLRVVDDGDGYPEELVRNGPKPFGKIGERAETFGMGLYSCQVLCTKHGGEFQIGNLDGGGAVAMALFRMGSG